MPSVTGIKKEATKKDEPVKLKTTSSKSNLQGAETIPDVDAAKPPTKPINKEHASGSNSFDSSAPSTEFVSFSQLTSDLIALFQKHEFLQESSLANSLGQKCSIDSKSATKNGTANQDEFLTKFDLLIKRVAWSKRQNNMILLSFFNQANVKIIQFYEMLVTILNICATSADLMVMSGPSGYHQTFLNKTLEFLHLLTTSNFISII